MVEKQFQTNMFSVNINIIGKRRPWKHVISQQLRFQKQHNRKLHPGIV